MSLRFLLRSLHPRDPTFTRPLKPALQADFRRSPTSNPLGSEGRLTTSAHSSKLAVFLDWYRAHLACAADRYRAKPAASSPIFPNHFEHFHFPPWIHLSPPSAPE